LTTVVPEKTILVISCLTALSSLIAASDLATDMDSPVNIAWSTRKDDEENERIRQSAGIRSPTWMEMISPGTRWEAGIFWIRPDLTTEASSGEYSRSACMSTKFNSQQRRTHVNSLLGIGLLYHSDSSIGD
jgi:hypothetical protein